MVHFVMWPLTDAMELASAMHGYYGEFIYSGPCGDYDPTAEMVWGTPWIWLPTKTIAEWALRPGYHTRVAIINAFQTVGGHVHCMLPIMVAEGFRQDRYQTCYTLGCFRKTHDSSTIIAATLALLATSCR